ncbi:MAG: SH3 domain-containing protein [Alkalibacterium sp.]|nr:SH3 domain-containing protein [Alkalibacterium sp.]
MSKNSYLAALTLLMASAVALSACNQEETTQEDSSQQEEETVENEESNGNEEEIVTDDSDEELDESDEEEMEEEIEEEEETVSIFGNQEGVAYISTDRLTVRADSSEESESLGSLVKGNEIRVLDEVETDEATWLQVGHHNPNVNEGWVSSEFTTADLNEVHALDTQFDDEEMNEFFTSPTLFEDNTIVAYYGHPNSEIMGIVGRHSVEDLIPLLKETTATYDDADESKGAVPAIYLVYGTVQPGGEVHKMNYDLVMSYIEAAYNNGVLVYIDHQMGRNHPTYSLNEIQSFLRYPNVHLALDPEWRTERPMQEVGHITGSEINDVQETMQDYIVSNDIQGTKQFVFHQFVEKMIVNVEEVSSEFDPVLLVHNTSGWGSPEGKRATHDRVAEATNIPYKGFKLWYYYSDRPGVHYDNPLMTPEEVLDLDPQPGLVIYQ